MKYILISLFSIIITTFAVYITANYVFKIQIRKMPLLLSAFCAIFVSLILPKMVVGITNFTGTFVILGITSFILAYGIAYYDECCNKKETAFTESPASMNQDDLDVTDNDSEITAQNLAKSVIEINIGHQSENMVIDAKTGTSSEELAVEQVDEQIVEPIEDQIIEQADNQIVEQIDEQIVELAKDQVVEQIEEQIVEPTEDQIVEQVDNQIVEQVDEQIVKLAKDQVVEQIEEQIVEQTEDQIVEQVDNQIMEQVDEQIVEPIDEQIVELAKDQVVEQIEEQIVEPAEDQIVEESTIEESNVTGNLNVLDQDKQNLDLPAGLVQSEDTKVDKYTLEQINNYSLDEFIDLAYTEKEQKNDIGALYLYKIALEKYSNSEAIAFVIVEMANIYKKLGDYDSAVAIFMEGKQLQVVKQSQVLELEFVNTIAYLRIVKNILAEHRLVSIPFNNIPENIKNQIETEFHEWLKLGY